MSESGMDALTRSDASITTCCNTHSRDVQALVGILIVNVLLFLRKAEEGNIGSTYCAARRRKKKKKYTDSSYEGLMTDAHHKN